MRLINIAFASILISTFSTASVALISDDGTIKAVQKDLETILLAAGQPTTAISFELIEDDKNSLVEFKCTPQDIHIIVRSTKKESVSAFYYGMHRLGFLFPHPRLQVSPTPVAMRLLCNQHYNWSPSLKHRGFHLHTEHPNEWVSGFFQGQTKIAKDTVIWLARNFQNLMQIQMLRGHERQFSTDNQDVIQLAHDLKIEVGIAVSFAMVQQKSYHLLPLWVAISGYGADDRLRNEVLRLADLIDFDFLTIESGFTEFTTYSYARTIRWLNLIAATLRDRGKYVMAKVHVSTNQYDDEHGNFNFLPSQAAPDVGVLPHTVMFYGLNDDDTPVYGRKNFKDIDKFMIGEVGHRKDWYFSETSYFVGMDIDVPLLLTDYLRARAQDYKHIVENKVDGILNFTTGQELGYWLFDWNLALQANHDYVGDELIGLKLLGENLVVWKKILDFQSLHFKKNQVITTISTSNLWDELPFVTPVHDRVLLRDLPHKASYLQSEIAKLEAALKESPLSLDVKDLELRRLLQVTELRMQQALYLRKAIADRQDLKLKTSWMNQARHSRESAVGIMQLLVSYHSHYPESFVFSEAQNPTSYKYGYGYTAAHLYFWEREEHIAAENLRNPLFMNIYDPISILF